MLNAEEELRKAVMHFWTTRSSQQESQGSVTGRKDAGSRGAVTGGKHADGFVALIAAIVRDAGLTDAVIHAKRKRTRTLPGYFRPSKEWDVVVSSDEDLIAVVEVKSQVGSFGNNFNNRVEEALGNAADFWAAYREGMFKPSQKPWLGYMFMLQETVGSTSPTRRVELSPFSVDLEFQTRSYAKRYELVCERLLREKLYDATCFFTSNSVTGVKGDYVQPNEELSIVKFARSLYGCASAFAQIRSS